MISLKKLKAQLVICEGSLHSTVQICIWHYLSLPSQVSHLCTHSPCVGSDLEVAYCCKALGDGPLPVHSRKPPQRPEGCSYKADILQEAGACATKVP